jgi:hypothetical protein
VDGQTQELLATTTQNYQRRFGTVFANDPNYKHRLPSADNGYGFDDADDYITRLMYGGVTCLQSADGLSHT